MFSLTMRTEEKEHGEFYREFLRNVQNLFFDTGVAGFDEEVHRTSVIICSYTKAQVFSVDGQVGFRALQYVATLARVKGLTIS